MDGLMCSKATQFKNIGEGIALGCACNFIETVLQ